MPRKSAAELAVIPILPGRGRPEPPDDLDRLERNVWNQVVDALPGHWLDPAGQIVLRRAVAQAAICERHEVRLRALRARDQDAGEDAQAIAIAHGTAAKVVAHLLTQLRATPRSRVTSRESGPRVNDAPRPNRPWDIRA